MKTYLFAVCALLATHAFCQSPNWEENGTNVYLEAPYKVGIQTINVDAELVVDGTLNASAYFIDGSPLLPWTSTNGNLTYAHPVGIGGNPNEMMDVKGTVLAEQVIIDLTIPGPDYVFDTSYDRMSLDQLERYTQTHKHLPYLPSADQMKANGINMVENQMGILRHMEELVLHQIEMENALKALESSQNTLTDLLTYIENRNSSISKSLRSSQMSQFNSNPSHGLNEKENE